jgi:hypothetical protein
MHYNGCCLLLLLLCRMVFLGGLAALQHTCFVPTELGPTVNSAFSECLLPAYNLSLLHATMACA